MPEQEPSMRLPKTSRFTWQSELQEWPGSRVAPTTDQPKGKDYSGQPDQEEDNGGWQDWPESRTPRIIPEKESRRVTAVSFTRQHFQHIADGIKSAPVDPDTRKVLANHFATHLAGTNPNFDRGRFVKACG